jgi:hypothetical protein
MTGAASEFKRARQPVNSGGFLALSFDVGRWTLGVRRLLLTLSVGRWTLSVERLLPRLNVGRWALGVRRLLS